MLRSPMDSSQTPVEPAAADPNKKEWWEELFQPAFPQGDPDVGKKEEEELRRMFSAFDKTALRRKYESVWNDMYGAEFAKQAQSSDRSAARSEAKAVSTNDESLLWNEEELRVLRRNTRALRILARSALLELRESSNENAKLKKTMQKTNEKLQRVEETMQEAVKANERLSILVDCLKKRNEQLETQFSLRDADLRALIEDRNAKKAKLNELTRTSNELQVEKRRLEFQLETVRDEHTHRVEQLTQKMTVERELQISALRKAVSIAQGELDRERTEHSVTKKALDRLSRHFVSLESSNAMSDGGQLEMAETSCTGVRTRLQKESRKTQKKAAVEAYFDLNEINNLHSLNELLQDLKTSHN